MRKTNIKKMRIRSRILIRVKMKNLLKREGRKNMIPRKVREGITHQVRVVVRKKRNLGNRHKRRRRRRNQGTSPMRRMIRLRRC